MPATDASQDGGASRTAAEAVEASDSEPAHADDAVLTDPHEWADGESFRAADAVTCLVALGHNRTGLEIKKSIPTFDPERPEVSV